MASFKVLAGEHVDHRTGKSYFQNDVVESDIPLDEKFKNKFQRVGGRTSQTPEAHDDSPDSSGVVMDDLGPKKPVATGKPADDKNLAGARRRGKASHDTAPAEPYTTTAAPEDEEDGEENGDEETTEGSTIGIDVTEGYPKASDAGLKVFRNGRNFFVSKEGEEAPLNEKPLKKAEVGKFITKQAKEQAKE